MSGMANAGCATELEMEASAPILALIHDAALHLGSTPALALEAARTGGIEVSGQRVAMVCGLDEDALVACIELGEGFLDDPEIRRTALSASTHLMLQFGITVARGLRAPQLMARWAVPGRTAEEFAVWLRDFAILAGAMRANAKRSAD